ncbi:MAG: hypothetical protein A2528_00625 [Candidatus Staskawiczbacteria bacterium RIFOXYD2_FULL_37_9]|uniref:Uncharacterized protein n=1 Tax=Candidatus Staskawiczbacteria bacterium RIFOXYB1_FULL_37_44 TaxID=1802223 RepID=A0A1G2IYB8_9BACT|nr:MAG: hypothetical protein A2358_04055 [Candidatus Staskawiczbacteria bacterium RIFOXYB1_FULL_37_44]OGZ83804.1 MAG: hypothetical protein A2416_00290 [Candidatus Staskawiczbacteria bacterium RIFOXYC1_FULL_37_52]OGZ88953.1 MAG: hypothetical protein A2581_01780 [Candidatus Staskawiczbacteria bacterium RIFOXYD1_FULL_37_110]OGZ89595.1 MAG: hypothetical protein A2444_01520 [Candidatus Staskawiczbacteria bacterium RIFOXYC2_FULL_37_19]OGZ93283.1 MAG: hypothetical protein A2528_00625 [Candidatus Stask
MLDAEDIKKLIEAQEPVFATKKDLQDIKDDIFEFKSEILTGQDQILKELKTLTEEKTVKDAQEKREKKVLEIHDSALKNNKILSKEQSLEIDNLRVF